MVAAVSIGLNDLPLSHGKSVVQRSDPAHPPLQYSASYMTSDSPRNDSELGDW